MYETPKYIQIFFQNKIRTIHSKIPKIDNSYFLGSTDKPIYLSQRGQCEQYIVITVAS